jgi:hypothetical protein
MVVYRLFAKESSRQMLCINLQSMGLGIYHGLAMVEIVEFDSLKMTVFCSKERLTRKFVCSTAADRVITIVRASCRSFVCSKHVFQSMDFF